MSLVVEIQFKVIRSTDDPDIYEFVGVDRGSVTLPDALLAQVQASKVVCRQLIEKRVGEMLDGMSL